MMFDAPPSQGDSVGDAPVEAPAPTRPAVARADAPVVVALVGRPNAGKSSLFNRVTGGDARVGNFPGITVDILESDVALPSGTRARIVDLPGLYSIEAAVDPHSDEGIARAFLRRCEERGDRLLIVQIVDATHLALGLRLTRELVKHPAPLLIVATQCDVLDREGMGLDPSVLATAIDAPVLAVSARKHATRREVLEGIDALLGGSARTNGRAEKDFSPDALAARALRERDDADVTARRRRTLTARADRVLLHPVFGPIAFLAIMSALFAGVFLIADPMTAICDAGVRWLGSGVRALFGDGLLTSFITDGALGGAGTVLAFLPQIVILTIAMELLDATGYLARGAFLVDRLLRLAGLGGRAFVPLLTAHACAVPAITATRIMRDPRERLTTILVLPLMTCSARIPTYSLLISAFFADRSPWVRSVIFVGLYFAGIVTALLASMLIQRTATRGRRLPLVLEMPSYRAPEAKVVARVARRAAASFVREVGSAILVVSLVLWGLLTVPMPGHHTAADVASNAPARVVRMQHSVAAAVGHAIEPVTRPLGFDWRMNVGLIGSFGARELMVSTLGVIFGIEDTSQGTAPLASRIRAARTERGAVAYSPRTALALMAFFVIACQCMSTVAAIRRETRSWRWPAFVLGYTYALAYVAAFVVYQATGLLRIA